jgi:uncharacterized protein YjbJ (UPF0337 family)
MCEVVEGYKPLRGYREHIGIYQAEKHTMNSQNTRDGIWNQIAGKWKQITGDIRSKWGDLTDDELMQINGEREKLVGKIQERYGKTRVEVEREVDEWVDSNSSRW